MPKSIGSYLSFPIKGVSEGRRFPSYKNIFENTTMNLNRSDTAQKLNVSLTTLDDWRRKGCPHTKTGKQVFFNLDDLDEWLNTRSGGELDYTQERAKLTKLQAEKVSLELEQLRGTLLPTEMVVVGWMGHVSNARAKMLAIPPKAAAEIVGMESYLEIEQFLTMLIHEALDELSTDGIPEEYSERIKAIAADLEAA